MKWAVLYIIVLMMVLEFSQITMKKKKSSLFLLAFLETKQLQ